VCSLRKLTDTLGGAHDKAPLQVLLAGAPTLLRTRTFVQAARRRKERRWLVAIDRGYSHVVLGPVPRAEAKAS
jgi:hypothetical protein